MEEHALPKAANAPKIHQEVAAVSGNNARRPDRVTAAQIEKNHSAPQQADNSVVRMPSGDAQPNFRSAPEASTGTLVEKPVCATAEETHSRQPIPAKLPAVKQERISFEFSATVRRFIFTSVVAHVSFENWN